MDAWIAPLMALIAVPHYGLAALFAIAFISATLLPLGSEPAVMGLVTLNADMFWPAILVATLGNTLGGALTWWMGYGAEKAYERVAHESPQDESDPHAPHPHDASRAARWLRRFGAKACLLSWLPIVGDPLCAVAGWLRLPFWPCVGYMAIGKFARYLVATAAFLHLFPNPLGT